MCAWQANDDGFNRLLQRPTGLLSSHAWSISSVTILLNCSYVFAGSPSYNSGLRYCGWSSFESIAHIKVSCLSQCLSVVSLISFERQSDYYLLKAVAGCCLVGAEKPPSPLTRLTCMGDAWGPQVTTRLAGLPRKKLCFGETPIWRGYDRER